MTYQIGNTTITAQELADMKNTEIDCKFWLKRIQEARRNAHVSCTYKALNGEVTFDTIKTAIENELAAIGVKVL